MDISCAFATSLETPQHIAHAESLGYKRAWCYDSPGLYPDVWMILAKAAEITDRIALGPGVLVPSNRHVMTNAAAIATLEALAPGRVVVAVGSGFTGRFVLGQKPVKWAAVRAYVEALRALLRGEDVEWEGATIRMIHPQGFVADRPVDVPLIIGAAGPVGTEVARAVGDGVFAAGATVTGFDWAAALTFGTVLEDGEDPGSERALQAAGPAVSVLFHFLYEHNRDALAAIPGGAEWAAMIETLDPRTRHLAVHEDHLVALTERDRPYVSGEALLALTTSGTREQVADKLRAMADSGVTEVAYQPAGADIDRELTAFMDAASLVS